MSLQSNLITELELESKPVPKSLTPVKVHHTLDALDKGLVTQQDINNLLSKMLQNFGTDKFTQARLKVKLILFLRRKSLLYVVRQQLVRIKNKLPKFKVELKCLKLRKRFHNNFQPMLVLVTTLFKNLKSIRYLVLKLKSIPIISIIKIISNKV